MDVFVSFQVWFQNKRARTKSRFPEVSMNNIAAMMPSLPAYGFPSHPMMSPYLPAPLMAPYAVHAYPPPFQPYM